jgi:hypothetical protein
MCLPGSNAQHQVGTSATEKGVSLFVDTAEATLARTTKFRDQHVELLQLAADLGGCCLDFQQLAESGTRAAACLNRLMGKLVLHLSVEDRVFYPELSASKDAGVAELAKRYAREMQGTAKAVTAYGAKWGTAGSIRQNPASFVAETREVIRILSDRITRENEELYTAADRVEGAAFV